MNNEYLYLQGELLMSDRDEGGNVVAFRNVGNVPRLSLSLGEAAAFMSSVESLDADSIRYGAMRRANPGTVSFSMELENVNMANLSLAMYGKSSTMVSGFITAEPHKVIYGTVMPLNNINVKAVSEVRNNDYNIVYTEGVDYVVDGKYGTITVSTTGSIPDGAIVTVNYEHAKFDRVEAFTTVPSLKWLRFQGINLFNNREQAMVIDAYKVRIDPINSFDLLSDSQVSLKLTGKILFDYRSTSNPDFASLLHIRKV